MKTCNCTTPQTMLGDGCRLCHPETWDLIDEMWTEDCREIEREDISFAFTGRKMALWDENETGAWDMVSEYFTAI